MTAPPDRYDIYYADKLWNLLPAVYRAQDTDRFDSNGPLREIVNRIGATAGALRRSIDRLWDDQSIETCDDWVVPYIGALLDANLVPGLDPRGQRLDVAKTIYYRRRKGTVAILEEIAADITGWDAKIVEFFRRLGRTRHGLDPPIGAAAANPGIAALQLAEGLVGPLTGTGIGGFADLRNAYGARQAHSAFDEFFHTADLRQGRGRLGWYGIPRLGIFLWRLLSLPVGPVTPVPVLGCPGWFTFDPTGRDVPLFAPSRSADAFGNWVSPDEASLPTPISQTLLDADLAAPSSRLYPAALAVQQSLTAPPSLDEIPAAALLIRPERGRFCHAAGSPPPSGEIVASYCYGFPSEIGAGPYDRRVGTIAVERPAVAAMLSGGSVLPVPLPASGTVVFADSLTYAGIDDVTVSGSLTLAAGPRQRPLIRLPGGAATFVGTEGSCLTLDGLFISGGDLVLRGSFDEIVLSCCTLDPGSAARGADPETSSPPASPFAVAADGRPLAPTRLWIEGQVKRLTADRCVLGPIRTSGDGLVETLAIGNSIVQAIPTSPGLAEAALALADGSVSLSRCTMLGQIAVHRLEASECILQQLAQVDDAQNGCVRFTAWADGSVLPRKFESVRIPQGAALFTNVDFGAPGYGQLLPLADEAILPPATPDGAPQNTISEGASDGAEMGAYARDKNPIKARALLIKFDEFMPAGLVPVVIPVT